MLQSSARSLASNPVVLNILVLVYGAVSQGVKPRSPSMCVRQGLFCPQYTSFSVGAVSQGVDPRSPTILTMWAMGSL